LWGNGYVGVRVLFTVCLNFILVENSLGLVEDVMHPVRCSVVYLVSTASLGGSFMPRVGAGVAGKKAADQGQVSAHRTTLWQPLLLSNCGS